MKTIDKSQKLEMVDDGVSLAERVAPMLADIRAIAEHSLGDDADRKALAKLFRRDGQAYTMAALVMGIARQQVSVEGLMFLTDAIERLDEYAAVSALADQVLAKMDLQDAKAKGGLN